MELKLEKDAIMIFWVSRMKIEIQEFARIAVLLGKLRFHVNSSNTIASAVREDDSRQGCETALR